MSCNPICACVLCLTARFHLKLTPFFLQLPHQLQLILTTYDLLLTPTNCNLPPLNLPSTTYNLPPILRTYHFQTTPSPTTTVSMNYTLHLQLTPTMYSLNNIFIYYSQLTLTTRLTYNLPLLLTTYPHLLTSPTRPLKLILTTTTTAMDHALLTTSLHFLSLPTSPTPPLKLTLATTTAATNHMLYLQHTSYHLPPPLPISPTPPLTTYPHHNHMLLQATRLTYNLPLLLTSPLPTSPTPPLTILILTTTTAATDHMLFLQPTSTSYHLPPLLTAYPLHYCYCGVYFIAVETARRNRLALNPPVKAISAFNTLREDYVTIRD